MALLALLSIAAAGAAATFGLRRRPPAASVVAAAALLACLIAASLMPSGTSFAAGAAKFVATPYARLWLAAAAGALLAAELVGLAHGFQRNLPLAALGGLIAVAFGLTATEPAAALLAVTAAAALGVVAVLDVPTAMPVMRIAADALRGIAVAGAAALAAVAWIGQEAIFLSPGALGAGLLLMAAALALRLAAVPLHVPLARLVATTRLTAAPLMAAWLPAAFAVVAVGWAEQLPAPPGIDLAGPHLLVAIVAVVTIAAASIVVVFEDDLARVLGYGLVADGGFVLLAMATADAAAWPAARTWILCLALSRTVMALAIVGLEGAHGTRRGRELHGWLRRTPALGVALAAATLVGLGLPGMLPFDARRTLAILAVGEPWGPILLILGALPLLPLGRLAWIGAQAPGPAVMAGRSERPILPPVRDTSPPPGEMGPAAGRARLRRRARQVAFLLGRGPGVGRRAAVAWQPYAVPIASAVTGLLALAAFAVALGLGDLGAAAAGPPPGIGPGVGAAP